VYIEKNVPSGAKSHVTLETRAALCIIEIVYELLRITFSFVGGDNSVGIATGYWLDGLGIESLWRRDFP
jgi:hypothetical protein